ncbi:MAG: MFS transporter [Bdellovibrionota bacterium]
MRNTKKLYFFSFFWMFLVIIPVIVPYFLKLGLSMSQVFQLQAIFGLGIVTLEVPTGYLCDMWGRKRSLIIGSFLSGLGFTYLIFIKSFAELVIYELIIATALSFVSGADISLLYDSVDKSDRKYSTKSLANMQFASVSGESVASILGGALMAFSFTHVAVANAIAGWIPFFIALTLSEPTVERMSRSTHLENFKEVFRHIFFCKDKILFFSFINLIIWGLATFIAVWLFQKYWADRGISLTYFGIIWAIYNISVGITGKQVHRLEHKIGAIPLLLFLSIAPVLGYLGMAKSAGFIGVAFGLLFYLSRGVTQILLKDALNWRIPSKFRATANSLQSFFFRLGFAIIGPLVGYGVDTYGMDTTLLSLGAVFIGMIFFTTFPLVKEIRKLKIEEIPLP